MRWLLWCCLSLGAPAWAADPPLSRQDIALAEWSRDTARLLAGTYAAEDVPRLARALGRLRDPAACGRLLLLSAGTDTAVAEQAAPGLGWTGCLAEVRARLDVETRPSVRAALWHALAVSGVAEDVQRATEALTGPEAAQGAYVLGRLATRGVVEARAAGPALPGLLAFPGDAARMAAFALFRMRQAPLPAVAAARVAQAYPRMADPAAKAWLVPVVLGGLQGAERAAFVAQALTDPARLVRAALLVAAVPSDLSGEQWGALLRDDDVWLRLAAQTRVGVDDVDPFASPDRLAALGAMGALPPPARTRLVTWLVAHDPTLAELTAAAGSDDPVVRELLVDHLGPRIGPFAALRDRVVLGSETPSLQLASLAALEGAKGRLSPAVWSWVASEAERGGFLVADRARALLAALGQPVPAQATRPLPGPPDLDRDLVAIAGLRVADVTTTQGTFRVDLDPDTAPLAVAAFAWLARHGALDGTTWHRVVPGFVAQTGCPRGDGNGGPDWFLADEVSALPFDAGSVGMARSGRDTGGSQWFVTTSPQPHLAGDYTRFGRVSDGLDVVMRLGQEDRVISVQIRDRL